MDERVLGYRLDVEAISIVTRFGDLISVPVALAERVKEFYIDQRKFEINHTKGTKKLNG